LHQSNEPQINTKAVQQNLQQCKLQKHTTILQQILAAQSDEKNILTIILQQILEQSNDKIKIKIRQSLQQFCSKSNDKVYAFHSLFCFTECKELLLLLLLLFVFFFICFFFVLLLQLLLLLLHHHFVTAVLRGDVA
jgi:hypothetical protein